MFEREFHAWLRVFAARDGRQFEPAEGAYPHDLPTAVGTFQTKAILLSTARVAALMPSWSSCCDVTQRSAW